MALLFGAASPPGETETIPTDYRLILERVGALDFVTFTDDSVMVYDVDSAKDVNRGASVLARVKGYEGPSLRGDVVFLSRREIRSLEGAPA